MADQDLINLYSGRILELAANIGKTGRLDAAEGQARKRAPLCGSTLSVEVTLSQGRVKDFAQEVRACALGQASASLLAQVVEGLTLADLQRGRAELAAMLDGGPAPQPPFEGFALLTPARDYRNRHASILLAFDATIAAVEAAG